jgi:hypothetical protein
MYEYHVAMPTRKSRDLDRLIVVVVVGGANVVVVVVVDVLVVVSPGYVVVVVVEVVVVLVVVGGFSVVVVTGFLGLVFTMTLMTGLGRGLASAVVMSTVECQATRVPAAGDWRRATTQVPSALPGPRVVK